MQASLAPALATALDPSEPLAQALERRRSHYNAAFALARHSRRNLDGEAFARYLVDTAGPMLVWVEDEAQADAVLDVLYDLGLQGVGSGLLGPHSRLPVLEEGLRSLFFGVWPPLASAPRRILGGAVNALHRLATTPGARPRQWVERMREVTALVLSIALSLGDLSPNGMPPMEAAAELWLQAGMVAAWRCGLACYREDALAVARTLDPSLVKAALGLEEGPGLAAQKLGEASQTWEASQSGEAGQPPLDRALSALENDRWMQPASVSSRIAASLLPTSDSVKFPALVRRVGDFTGFGGTFSRPPQVFAHDDHIYVVEQPRETSSHDSTKPSSPSNQGTGWLLCADACGATLHATTLPPLPTRSGTQASPPPGVGDSPGSLAPQGHATLAADGTVSWNGQHQRLTELAQALSWAATSHTLAVTLPRSHRILLVALIPAP